MKVWSLHIKGSVPEHWLCFTKEEAEAEARESILARFDDEPVDDTKSTDELIDLFTGYFSYEIVEHDLSLHPAVKEVRATLYVCLERLQANDMAGEEQPYMEDVATALQMIGN